VSVFVKVMGIALDGLSQMGSHHRGRIDYRESGHLGAFAVGLFNPEAGQTGKIAAGDPAAVSAKTEPTGTFINKMDPAWLRKKIGGRMRYEIYPWRSVNVRFLRAVIHPVSGGKLWLRLLFWLEERFPRFFGEKGQYPLIVIRK